MNYSAYYRQKKQMADAQAAYDNRLPPEYWDDEECIDIEPDFEAMNDRKNSRWED